jgi:hypothetical protein
MQPNEQPIPVVATRSEDRFGDVQEQIIAIGPGVAVDDIALALDRISAIKARVKELESDLKERMLDKIREDGPMVIGSVKYWAGVEKTTKCRSVPAAIECALEVSGGDMERLAGVLSSNAVKHGAFRALLDEYGQAHLFEKLFETVEQIVLKDNGKPAKTLQKADQRFLK